MHTHTHAHIDSKILATYKYPNKECAFLKTGADPGFSEGGSEHGGGPLKQGV